MGKFEKYLGKGQEVEIKGGNFTFKPLGVEHLPKILRLFGKMAKLEGQEENLLEVIGEPGQIEMIGLIKAMVIESYPDEPKEESEQFVAENFMFLFPVMMETNSFGITDVPDIKAKLEEVRKAKDVAKEVTGNKAEE